MLRRAAQLVAAALSIATLPLPTLAAEIGLSSKPGCLFELSGMIVDGDADRLGQLVAQNPIQLWPGFGADNDDQALCLNSPGGSFQEGNAIALQVHEAGVATRVGPGARCESACSLIFMSGRLAASEENVPRRILHVDGRLGFHAPFVQLNETREFPGKVVNEFVPELSRMIAVFIRHAAFRSEFQDRPSISLSLLAAMMDTPQNELFLIDTVERAAKSGVQLDGLGAPRQFTNADFAQLCENEIAWLHDKESVRVTPDRLPFTNMRIVRKQVYGGSPEFIEFTKGGLSNQVCAVQVSSGAEGVLRYCLEDGFTGVGLGFCDHPVQPWTARAPWWHAMPPDMPLAALQ